MKTFPMTFIEFREEASRRADQSYLELFPLEILEDIVGEEYVKLPKQNNQYAGHIGACFKNGVYLMEYTTAFTRSGEVTLVGLTGSRTQKIDRDKAIKMENELEKQREYIENAEKLLEIHRMRRMLEG